jgi:YrbI family 3-deoxy-D-manno-octulosonate 8-phosphate phosphatase
MKNKKLPRTAFKKIKLVIFDFDGVFTDNRVIVFDDGREAVVCSREDGLGIIMLRERTKCRMLVLSKERNPVVAQRCRKLNVPCIQGIDDKLTELNKILKKMKLTLSETAYVGNDLNDIECMEAVGLPIAPADAHPAALAIARYITGKPGGRGAVREVCDLLIDSTQEF